MVSIIHVHNTAGIVLYHATLHECVAGPNIYRIPGSIKVSQTYRLSFGVFDSTFILGELDFDTLNIYIYICVGHSSARFYILRIDLCFFVFGILVCF